MPMPPLVSAVELVAAVTEVLPMTRSTTCAPERALLADQVRPQTAVTIGAAIEVPLMFR